jgi:hypothetical protein
VQVKKNQKNQLEIKTKKGTITIGDQVYINDVDLEGPGEYEIAGISVEGVDDSIYLLNIEDIPSGLVDFKTKISKEKIEKLSDVDFLIAKVNGETEAVIDQVNQIEPKTVVYTGSEGALQKIKSSGVSLNETEELKLTKSDIAEEQKAYFIESNGKGL